MFWKYALNLLYCDFNEVALAIEITLRHGCSPVNLLHIFRTTFLNNTSGRLLLKCVFRSSVVEFNNTETCKPVILKWFQSKVQPYLGLRHESNIWNFDLREYTFVSIFCKRGKNLSCYGKILYCTLFSIEFTSYWDHAIIRTRPTNTCSKF